MLLDCLASCTRRLSPRWERKAVDEEEGPTPVPVPIPVKAAPEAAPEAPRVPTADDANGPEPPFQTDLTFFTILGDPQTIHVTVDHSLPVNVVTNRCLNGLGFKPLRQAIPPQLSELAANALPGLFGWQNLGLRPIAGSIRDIDFVVVGDDYHCEMLLGREFKGFNFKRRAGIYPNYINQKSREEREEQLRKRQVKKAEEAEAAANLERKSAEQLEQSRKQDPKSSDGAGEGTSA